MQPIRAEQKKQKMKEQQRIIEQNFEAQRLEKLKTFEPITDVRAANMALVEKLERKAVEQVGRKVEQKVEQKVELLTVNDYIDAAFPKHFCNEEQKAKNQLTIRKWQEQCEAQKQAKLALKSSM
jgi:hypothetical protein